MLRDLAEEFSIHYETVSDYARRCGVSRQWVHQLILRGAVNAVRIGHSWYIKKNTAE